MWYLKPVIWTSDNIVFRGDNKQLHDNEGIMNTYTVKTYDANGKEIKATSFDTYYYASKYSVTEAKINPAYTIQIWKDGKFWCDVEAYCEHCE